jgi:molecular chaperone GrpE
MTRTHDDTSGQPDAASGASASQSAPAPDAQAQRDARELAVAELTAQLDEAQRLAEQYKDQALRRAAEFENYKRRTESEISAIIRHANENLLTALLPVVEDFNRFLKSSTDAAEPESLQRGIELIAQKLGKILERQGLVPFESVGKPFDVAFHDALLQVPKPGVPAHTVVEEVERGYMLGDRVLRHAKVVVSSDAEGAGDGRGSSGTGRESGGQA